MREWQDRVHKVVEVCESSIEASVALHAITGDCLLCLNKLYAATDDGQLGTAQLQCGGCTKPPVLHVSCMIKLQDKGQKCPMCRQPFTNARADPNPDYHLESDDGTFMAHSLLHHIQHLLIVIHTVSGDCSVHVIGSMYILSAVQLEAHCTYYQLQAADLTDYCICCATTAA
jgi:hypothetical protein